ncbi:MAG: class I SAM-dependent methyltransferase [Bacteroidetes bacterium]|nr:class I SAM-dependent methyltransferase [Bacteroidota bacterium]
MDYGKLEKAGITDAELRKYLPRYILNPTALRYGWFKRIGLLAVQCFLRVMVKLFLRPRNSTGFLDQSEINRVYTREAKTYNRKHHLTTRGMDLVWRRVAGWFVSIIGRNGQGRLKILDLCTGTGLTVKEMHAILQEWDVDAEIIGLDYNERMLQVANNGSVPKSECIKFVRGDATNLAGLFELGSINVVTQIFGIGGIPEPLKVFKGVLQILKTDGQFLMIDMHKPIPEQPGEWPLFLRWCHFPVLEMVVYEDSTIPVVLNRLWGWRDTTLCFYLLPLTTYRDCDGRYWGFKVRVFEQESQRWWFALPLMPIARIAVEKVEISEEISRKREIILNACVTSR